MEEKLNLTQEWDKVFPKNEKVEHKKITFHNRYGITLAADLYMPKGAEGKLPAIAVSGPFGAGTVFRPVCTGNGGERLLDYCFRSFFYW